MTTKLIKTPEMLAAEAASFAAWDLYNSIVNTEWATNRPHPLKHAAADACAAADRAMLALRPVRRS